MGQAGAVLRALSCRDCAMYVCNAMQIHSECCGMCSCEYVTEKIDPQESDSDFELEMSDCCSVRKGKNASG